MKILTDKETLRNKCSGKYIFIDNDFLGQLFEHEDVFTQFIELLPDATLIIDPYIELEFRRDVFLPKQKTLKEKFINNPLFEAIPDHQEIYKKVQVNALLLSQIYAHQRQNGASLVDLMLGARLMQAHYSSLIVTGNRRDFPSCIFDNVTILNLEQTDGAVQAFYMVEFNSRKFEKCYDSFKKLEK